MVRVNSHSALFVVQIYGCRVGFLERVMITGLDLFSGIGGIGIGLGNSVVPLQVKKAFEKLIGIENTFLE